MKGGARAAAALGIGYMLGRNKKFRTAALMAAATAVGGKGIGGMAMQRGMKMLSNTETFGKIAPQLGEITDTVRGDLLPAGKAAAGAAVTSRFDTLTDSLHDRAERLRNPAETVAGGAEGAKKTAGRATSTAGRAASAGSRHAGRRGATAEPSEADEDERDARAEDEYEDEDDDLERGEADDYEDDEPDYYDDDERDEDEDDEVDAAGTPRRRTTTRRRSPVSRTRR